MRTPAGTSVRTILVIASSLLLLTLGAGCNPKENAELSKAFRSLPLSEAASQIAAGYGTVVAVHEGRGIPVAVFQEMHSSVLQQAQIAAMLNRLYERFGLRAIGLEGACRGEFSVPANVRGTYKPSTPLGEREDAAVQLLANGEISGPELLAVVYPDIRLEPIEDATLYTQSVGQESSASPIYYLVLVALSFLPAEEQSAIAKLDPEQQVPAFLDAIDANSATKGLMESYSNSCCCDVSYLDRIATLAVERKVATRQDVQADFADLRRFDQAACKRGRYMAGRMISDLSPAASKRGEAVIAIACGAAHCEIPEELAKAGRPYIVIRPAAFDAKDDSTRLSYEDMERKTKALSVVHSDVLRQASEGGGKKYPPVIDRLWVKARLDVDLLASRLAHLAAVGGVPPFTEETLAGLSLTCSSVVPGSLSVDKGEVVFATDTLNENGTPVTIWVRSVVDQTAVEQALDQRLDQLIEDLAHGVEQARQSTVAPGMTAVAVSSSVKAVFCSSREVAQSMRIVD